MSTYGTAVPTSIDPIVISGMAVEAPGGIDTPAALWSALSESRELVSPFPRDRGWPVDDLLSRSEQDGWGRVCDAGGFMDSAMEFDPLFFGITHREAVVMHPQQRVAMRIAWKTLENAGINPGAVAGTDGGCFVGMSMTEYGSRTAVADSYTGHRTVGMGQLGGAGRISHCLGLTGPSMAVDSACASSLSALHLAATAVQMGECDWALAGAVCVLGAPTAFFEFARLNALSNDGHCRAYADDASGTLWGEGAGMVLVEHESRAKQLGHRIYGRILAIRTNHNGKGKPILVPRIRAQEELVRKTIDAAQIDPADIGMIEGHGTATLAGDPMELIALFKTYGAGGSEALLGSIKSNAGHAQAASGMLGLIKLLLSGQHGHIPPTLFSDNPTKKLDWDLTGLRLATKLHPWEPKDGVRYGAASSFGAGGANAHAIIAMPASTGE
ncbi:putative polyketide synthase MbtC [Mycobacterium kubicae]|uniref:Polyketide synthase n=2 Tax=Mycobacterium kubicae TaxID=120959 RepID=A0AAX1J7F2_9MYCO|nr:polyketide synthase [Mycobacterium kubicae]MCV7095141.1 polyketide synthase [Mycobacterium kubicae]QNI12770.1 polyketide synthase [Mycobacterium kubicae]QPI36284.1 polyketide synthase [Mycobacterium kubicae]GFG67814.1 putative polyketide synthase MbtC [Mycobacterium kubicae]